MTQATATADPFASWTCCALPAGSVRHPDQLDALRPDWLPAAVPGTAAAALRDAGRWDFDRPPDLDGQDWWYRTTFAAPARPLGHPCRLFFDGLATLAEVWLNGQLVLITDNMFRGYAADVTPHLRPHNELVLGFRSLTQELQSKRPRPRWKTNLVKHQQLRWIRTTLLGRIPGWTPPAPPVGPWRAVRLDTRPFNLAELHLASGLKGDDGIVTLRARVQSAVPLEGVSLRVGDCESRAEIQLDSDGLVLRAALRVPRPPLWWPHSHGEQPLCECTLHLRAADAEYSISCGKIGFRTVEVRKDNGFSVHVNGVPVYCRGACWTVGDILAPGAGGGSVARDLRLARDAGANMLRVGGTMVYESDEFYQRCDELGILVWQDFMFANMDYPVADPGFAANIEAEARYQLARLAHHPCVVVYCGNSEVEQQAAMRGLPRETWRNDWFATRLPSLCAEISPGIPYVPSTPSGGALPFHMRDGLAHYYGVGAYLRSSAELRQADVKFSPECLGFANVPEPETLEFLPAGSAAVHHPVWKQRVPRDTGAGWDFDDVRDHYLKEVFAVDPLALRYADTARYLQLSRVVSGEMMARVFAEWRSGHTRNAGGLVWFFKDLWPGAGWGVVDSRGVPKAAYYFLRRNWRDRQLTLTDEGLDGLHLHITNETAERLTGTVELLLLKSGRVVVARGNVPCELAPRSRRTLTSAELLGGFFDVTYAYRFGPPPHDLAVATLFDHEQCVLSEAFYFVKPREPAPLPAVRLDAEAEPEGHDHFTVVIACDHFLHAVSLDVPGFLPDDNYFHLPPGRTKRVHCAPAGDRAARFRGSLEALNLPNPVAIRLKETPARGRADVETPG